MPLRKPTENDIKEMNQWLFQMNINPNKLHREFSDCVPVAQMLKKFYPRIIDLHNYPPRNNTELKLNNWQTLNSKALGRLGIHVNKHILDKLSKGTPGAIEMLLCEIMMLEKSGRAHPPKQENVQEKVWTENDDVLTVPVNKKIGDAIVKVPQKMILYSIYEEKVRECNAKDAILNASHQKIAHFENILRLKTERIEELCGQLAKLSVRTLMKQHNLENSSPRSTVTLDPIENE